MLACEEKTRSDLEWDRLLEALASRCAGPLGAQASLSLEFCSTWDGVVLSLAEIREARELLDQSESLPASGAQPISACVERLRAGGVLAAEELRAVARALGFARTLRRFVHRRKDSIPNLAKACMTDPHLDAAEDAVSGSFGEDGRLSDRASPRLAELRQDRQTTRERLLHKLDDIMQRYGSALQDQYYTEREGRFVLPVRADSHERFTGIVHAASGSGQTLFVEPRAIIPLGNRLKMIDAEIEREEYAIYSKLSAILGEQLESVAAAEQALAHAELRAACAQLSVDLGLSFPLLVKQPLLDLVSVRHPLLVLDGVSVVPSDVTIESGRALVISGPNAGGKSVVLKTLGLVALMTRAGLPVPCKPDSRVGLFDRVVSDMGDEQSIAKNLSTFSAHVRNLTSILDVAEHGTLVLLDEIASGTDPREGEALAAALLDGLCARGGAVACTTHYEGLKALALGDQRFTNASVGFDLGTMSPTFRLAMGLPGASSALAIARRFGMPSLIVSRAEGYLSTEDRGFEELVRKLNDERRALELARSASDRERAEVEKIRKQLDSELAQAKARERQMISRDTQALLSAVRHAREELREAELRLRSKKLDQPSLRDASRVIERVASKVAIGGELEPPLDAPNFSQTATPLSASELKTGVRVYVPRIRAEATVLEVLSADEVRLSAGAVKLTASVGELRQVRVEEPTPAKASSARAPRKGKAPGSFILDAASDPEVPIQTTDNRCDLRGLRMEEAIAMAEQFLDRCLNSGLRVAFLVHGHGTGILREAIRKTLSSSPYVARFRPGEQGEGGDGVTVAWLR